MKLYFSFVAYIFIAMVFLVNVPAISAHVLETGGSVGAVLHIDPGDDPAAGEPAYFFLELKDTQKRFRPQDCECSVSILRAGTEIHKQGLYDNGQPDKPNEASFSFTFPEPDVYAVKVSGKPVGNSFTPFTLTYDIRVSRTATGTTASAKNIPWGKGIPVLAIGGIIAAIGYRLFRKKEIK
jgi:hypothetical protein